MYSTALKTEEEKQEYFDSDNELNSKILQLAQLIKESKHIIAFTWAGVSCQRNTRFSEQYKYCPQYRTWCLVQYTLVILIMEVQATNYKNKEKIVQVPFLKAVPTPTHVNFIQSRWNQFELEKLGFLKFVISQNVNVLYRRSGFPPEKLAELH